MTASQSPPQPFAPLSAQVETTVDPHTRWVLAFIRLWAVAHIVHLTLANNQRLDTPWNIVTVLAAIVVILKPSSGLWLTIMALAQLCDLVWEMPLSPDHWMLVGFVDLALLLTMAVRRSWSLASVQAALPAARVIVLIAYSAAALAKYNSTFLEPVTSCATAMASASSFGLSDALHAGPLWLIMTIGTETSIPIMLLVPRLRRHGVRIGMIFHLMLTVSPVIAVEDFSAALYALFFLFLSDEDAGRVLDRLSGLAKRSAIARDARRAPWVTAGIAFFVVGFLGYLSVRVSTGIQIVMTATFLIVMLWAALASWRAARGVRAFGRPLLVQAPVFLCILLWASSPYLGLRTTGVFTMFSGVRTEAGVGNHLFLPTLRVVDWQDDLVIIHSTNDPKLESAEDGHLGIPLVALRRLAMDDPDLEVVGDLHGKRTTFGPGEGQVRLEPLPQWQYKLFLFRPVPVDGEPFCTN
jgi:hypothetical protein